MEIDETHKNHENISLAEYINLLNIFTLQIKDSIIFRELAKKLNTTDGNGIFRNVRKQLIELKICEYIETIGTSRFYKINNKKLDAFIRKNYIYQKTKKFVILSDPYGHMI